MPLFKRLKGLGRDHGAKNSGELLRGQEDSPKDDTSAPALPLLTENASVQHLEQAHPLTAAPLPPIEGSVGSTTSPRLPSTPTTSDSPLIDLDKASCPTLSPQSLWDRAYTALRARDRGLVEDYEKLLSRELSKTSRSQPLALRTAANSIADSNSNISSSSSHSAAREGSDDTDNLIDDANPQERQVQLAAIITAGLQRADEKKLRWTIAGHEFDIQDKISQGVGLVLGMKEFVSEAVKVSPEASLVWAGVCIILPLLTNPSTAEQANKDGFTYITDRMHYYVALEPLLWPKNLEPTATVPGDLKTKFEARIIDLYQYVLEFQFKSVLRFYRSRSGNFGRDLIKTEDWNKMRSTIDSLEAIVRKDSDQINTLSSRQELENLSENASGSLKTMHQLLSVAERQLQVTEGQREISSKTLQATEKLVNLTIDAKKMLQDNQAVIDIPIVENALYDSEANQDILLCQHGTRVGIMNDITTWANDITRETLYWLYGPAGTGKSTIAASFIRLLVSTNQLGATYLFKRGDKDRNDTALFFPTIASQLVLTIPSFRIHLKRSLEKIGNTKIEKKALEEQFKTLILAPLSEVLPEKSGILTKVIVVDALDECERYGHIPRILNLLAQLQKLSTIRLCVFLTSRSASPIVEVFEDFRRNSSAYSSLALHEEFYNETTADIRSFLTKQFANIKSRRKITKDPWPESEKLDHLFALASQPSPLFIYAATLCRFVNDETGRKMPTKQLELWLKECSSNTSQLSQIYLPVLRQVLLGTDMQGEKDDPLSEEDQLQLLQVLGSIILLATPLSARALAALLNIEEYDVNHWLQNLHAVLNIPSNPDSPVQILHKSFSDFLLGDKGTDIPNFKVNAPEIHAMLALKCIVRMQTLKKDICDIREPGMLRNDIDNTIIALNISPDLNYACLHWVYHLQNSGRDNLNPEEVYTFLSTHVLHWLEALSLIGKISEGILAISSLESYVPAAQSPSLYALVHDIKRFALYNRSVIEQAPLQLYYSALLFAPEMSIIKGLFVRYLPVGIRIEPQVHGNWSAALLTLEGHTNEINNASFSPDGKLIASASQDATVRLWDVATGTLLQTLLGHTAGIATIVFSPDGKLIASASQDATVRLWDVATGTSLQTLPCNAKHVRAIVFSLDAKQVKSASEYAAVQIWDVATGTLLQTLPGHTMLTRIIPIAFSLDGKRVASASRDTVRLQDVATGAVLQTFQENTAEITAVAFSPDGRQVASASLYTVQLCDVATGALLQTLLGHTEDVTAIVFSPDGKLVASASLDATVRLWNAATGTQLKVFEGHTTTLGSVALSLKTTYENEIRISFSPDGTQMVSASDMTARLWNTEVGGMLQTLEGHTGLISSVMFSSDGKHIVSASHDKTLRLWDAVTAGAPSVIKGSTNISVSPHESRLEKDKAYIRLIYIDNGSLFPSVPSIELSMKNGWIIKKNNKVLWLPPEHRPYSSAIRPGKIMLKYFPGRAQTSF